MREPTDEFGRLFRKLRKAKAWTAAALSDKVARNRAYFSAWERDATLTINKAVLHKVCEVLQLSEAERRQLERLADRRNQPDDPGRAHGSVEDIIINVCHALVELPLEGTVDASGRELFPIGEAASWALAFYAAGGVEECGYERLAWPEFFRRERIIVPPKSQQRPIPAQFLKDELPGIRTARAPNKDDARQFAPGMAAVYRRWLFCDLERSRAVVGGLARCKTATEPGVGAVLSLTFKDQDADDLFHIEEVTCNVIKDVCRRELAAYLWETHNTRPDDDLHCYPYCTEQIDAQAILAIKLAENYLKQKGAPLSAWQRQQLQDTLYIVNSPAWHSSEVAVDMYGMLRLLNGTATQLDLETNAEAWDAIDEVRQRAMGSLASALVKVKDIARHPRPQRPATRDVSKAKARAAKKRRKATRSTKTRTTKKPRKRK